MPFRREPRPISKPVVKAMTEGVKETGKKNRLVAKRNIEKMKKDGWNKVSSPKDKHNRLLDVNTNTDDLVLMEK